MNFSKFLKELAGDAPTFILGDNDEVVAEPDFEKWARWMKDNQRRCLIRIDRKDDMAIATTFCGFLGRKSALYQTILERNDEPQKCIGARDRKDALANHETMKKDHMCEQDEPMMDYDAFNGLMSTVDMLIPDDASFFIFVAKNGGETKCKFGSSMERESAIAVMKEFILRNGSAEEWMNNMDTE